MFEVYMLAAKEGDAYHVVYGTEEQKHHLIIDGGPSSSGGDVAEIMEQIIDDKEKMDLILTHIDADHIQGLTTALQKVKKSKGTKRLNNAVEHVFYNTCQEYQRRENLPVQEGDIEVESLSGDVSVAQGIKFLTLLEDLKLNTRLVYSMQGDCIDLHGAELYFISPGKDQMKKLNDDEEKYILKQEEKKKSGDTAAGEEPEQIKYCDLSAYEGKELNPKENRSPNLSSLAFLMKYGESRVAFLGDARADVCLEGLKCIHETYKDEENNSIFEFPYEVDFMKVAHHGSEHSNSEELFRQLPTDYYLISTNGGAGNSYGKMPSKHVLCRMVETHKDGRVNILVSDNWWEKGLMKEYFSEADKEKYMNPEDPKITLIDTTKEHFSKCIKERVMVYGSKK